MGDILTKLTDGKLAKAGHYCNADLARIEALISKVKAEGIETVRIMFADQHGITRGKTIVADKLASVFCDGLGMPSTILLKDTSQKTVFQVWTEDAGFGSGQLTGSSDVLLAPDPDTFRKLPWLENTGWMLCDVLDKQANPVSFASRQVLKTAIRQLKDASYDMLAGLEVEFHVFKTDEAPKFEANEDTPSVHPEVSFLTNGLSLLGEGRSDALEPIANELRKACLALDLPIRSMEAEFGPSQLEFVFDPADPLTQADNLVLFRSMVKQVCAREGYHATFMCKPRLDGAAASGWHLHQSVMDIKTGENVFVPDANGQLSDVARKWVAGLLAHAEESCLVTTPTINGYKRYQAYQLAPNRIQWAHDNRGAMIRAIVSHRDNASRIENRIAEPAANPHYVLASQILGGLSGIRQSLELPEPVEKPYDSSAKPLPSNLLDAIHAFEAGSLFAENLGEDFVRYYAHIKRAEWERYVSEISEWEQREYFSDF